MNLNKKIAVVNPRKSDPVLKSAKINQLLFNFFSKKRLNFVSIFFAESYCVNFKKNDY